MAISRKTIMNRHLFVLELHGVKPTQEQLNTWANTPFNDLKRLLQKEQRDLWFKTKVENKDTAE